jgi:processive 1,2-diacylglycerol beta-glucosyltransferase
MSPLSRRLYSDGYLFLISHLPGFWGLVYFLSDTPGLSWINVHLRRLIDARMCSTCVDFLVREAPSHVISTQFLASEIVSLAKEKRRLKTHLTTVVTDFGVHNFWINPHTDVYACAADSSKKILTDKGIPPERIVVTGIPIDKKFIPAQDKRLLLTEMGLSPDRFTVLIATGGIGIGPIEAIVDDLKDDLQLLVVCGSNQSLQDKLSRKAHPGVRVFGFIDYMEKLMSVCDVVVTKAGGLTVSEGLSKGLPMVFFCLIPGQETINARTMEGAGVGFIARSLSGIRQKVLFLKNQPSAHEACRHHALDMARPDAARRIIAASGI